MMDKNGSKFEKKIKIIYQDKYIIVLNKPAGLVVHKGDGVKEKNTLVDYLLENKLIEPLRFRIKSGMTNPGGEWRDKNRVGIIHRLDKDTSGLIVVGRNQQVVDKVQRLFKNREVIKKYFALVWNETNESGSIVSSIGRKPGNKSVMTTGRGKIAITDYELIDIYNFNKNIFSLLNVNLKTGRTHQIRVHMKSIGHPLVGDPLYTKNSLNQITRRLGFDRLFLQSYYIRFKHPFDGKDLELKIDIEKQLKEFLNNLALE